MVMILVAVTFGQYQLTTCIDEKIVCLNTKERWIVMGVRDLGDDLGGCNVWAIPAVYIGENCVLERKEKMAIS